MKKILVVGSIFISLGLLVIINKEDNQDVLLKDNISIIESNTIAMYKSDDKTNYTSITEMPESGYTINEEKSYCTTNNKTPDTTSKLKTVEGNHVVTGLKKNSKCYIWFDKKEPTGSETIFANVTAKDSPTTFTGVATTDEGVFKVEDGMYGGYSYYWRGAVTNNHVIFANKCWRIVRINGDNSIRLIYNGTPSSGKCTGNGNNTAAVIMGSTSGDKYYSTSNGKSDNSSYVGWTYTLNSQRPSNNATATASNAKTQTESWFNNNSNFTDAQRAQVAEGKFCNERATDNPPSNWSWSGYTTTWNATGTKFTYKSAKRIIQTHQPVLSCTADDIYTLKVGSITSDEAVFAGGGMADNRSYYLYTSQDYWTMSPSYWDGGGNVWIFFINSGGYISNTIVGNILGLRPVINLNSNVTFKSGGKGISSNPYVVQ